MKKRYRVALGALSAALGACGASEYKPPPHGAGGAPAMGSGGTGADATGGSSTTPGAGNPGSGGTSSGRAGAGSGAKGGTGATAGTGDVSAAGAGDTDAPCSPGVPATSQVPRMKNAAYDNVVRDLLGISTLTTAQGKKPSDLLYPDMDGSLNADAWRVYQDTASTIAHEVMTGANKTNFISCDASTAGCLSDTVKSFGRKAFRRPLTDTEVTSFMRLANGPDDGTPDDIAEAILFTFLASPSFIMLPELGSSKEGDAIKLTDYEVATRLSFTLWNSVPDGALNDAADNGQLETKEQILAQAQRMLGDMRAQPMLVAFGHAYLGIGPGTHWINGVDHDPSVFPEYTAAVPALALSEIDAFFGDVTFGGGAFKDIFLSNAAYVNRDTAPIYGLDPAAYGSDLTRVELDADRRPGVLTRIAFLSTFSHYSETALILRGAFVSTKLIGVDPGPPIPMLTMTPPPPGDFKTEREEVEALTAPTDCAGCHVYLNAPGFVLEHYDAIGSWQDTDQLGGPIDGTADVTFEEGKQTISSPRELMQALAASASAQRIFAERLVTYASGRDPNVNDACTVNTLAAKMAADDYPVRDLFADFTQADSFRLRTVGQ